VDGQPVQAGEWELWRFGEGTHVLRVAVTDGAGHSAVRSVEFKVTWTGKSPAGLTQGFAEDGTVGTKVSARILGGVKDARRAARRGDEKRAVARLKAVRTLIGAKVKDRQARAALTASVTWLIKRTR
jgi:hypothetical protein